MVCSTFTKWLCSSFRNFIFVLVLSVLFTVIAWNLGYLRMESFERTRKELMWVLSMHHTGRDIAAEYVPAMVKRLTNLVQYRASLASVIIPHALKTSTVWSILCYHRTSVLLVERVDLFSSKKILFRCGHAYEMQETSVSCYFSTLISGALWCVCRWFERQRCNAWALS